MSEIYGNQGSRPGNAVYVDAFSVHNDKQNSSSMNIAILADVSGSTADKLDGVRKIELERKLIAEILDNMERSPVADKINVSLRIVGQADGPVCECRETALIVPMGPLRANHALINEKLLYYTPAGMTPLTYALSETCSDLSGLDPALFPGSKHVLAVTDGIETKRCAENPEHMAGLLAGKEISVDILGIGLKHKDSGDSPEAQLARVARAGRGQFRNYRTAAEVMGGSELKTQCQPDEAISKRSAAEMGKRHEAWGKVCSPNAKNRYTPGAPSDQW